MTKCPGCGSAHIYNSGFVIKADIDKKLTNPHDPLGMITDAIKQKLMETSRECDQVVRSLSLGSSLSYGVGTRINPRSDVKFFTENDDRSKARLGDMYLDIQDDKIYVLANYPPAHWELVATRAPQVAPVHRPKIHRMLMVPHDNYRITNQSLHHSVQVAFTKVFPDSVHEGGSSLDPESPPWELLYMHRENLVSQTVAFIASEQVGLNIDVHSGDRSAKVRRLNITKTLAPGDTLLFVTEAPTP